MKTMMTLPELATEVERVRDNRVDYLADTRRMGFYAGSDGRALALDDVGAADIPFPLTDYAEGQVAGRLGIPKKFWDRLASDYPGLLQGVVGAILVREPEERMVRTLDGKVRAFLSNRYRRIENVDVLTEAILPAFAQFEGVEIRSAGITDTRMYVKATFPNVEAEVRVGEILRAGVMVTNSEVGAGKFAVSLFVEVLKCTNGMVGDDLISQRHTGGRLTGDDDGGIFSDEAIQAADRATMLEARDLILSAADEARFEAMVASIRGLAEVEPEPAPPEAIKRLGDRYDLSDGEQDAVLKHLISGGDLSAWGYTNAVTRTAADVESYDRATELERLGGLLVKLPAQDWRLN